MITWLNIQDGTVVEGPALPADLTLTGVNDRLLAHLNLGMLRVRDAGSALFIEFTTSVPDTLLAIQSWLKTRPQFQRAQLCFRNPADNSGFDMLAVELLNPGHRERHKKHLEHRDDHHYTLHDLCDAATPMEVHVAAYWNVLNRELPRARQTKTLLSVSASEETNLILTAACGADRACSRWTARILNAGSTVRLGAAYLISGLPAHEAMELGVTLGAPVLFAEDWKGQRITPVDTRALSVDLEDAEAVCRALGGVYFDVIGSGSWVNETVIRSYGWNQLREFRRPWDAADAPLEIRGRKFGFQ